MLDVRRVSPCAVPRWRSRTAATPSSSRPAASQQDSTSTARVVPAPSKNAVPRRPLIPAPGGSSCPRPPQPSGSSSGALAAADSGLPRANIVPAPTPSPARPASPCRPTSVTATAVTSRPRSPAVAHQRTVVASAGSTPSQPCSRAGPRLPKDGSDREHTTERGAVRRAGPPGQWTGQRRRDIDHDEWIRRHVARQRTCPQDPPRGLERVRKTHSGRGVRPEDTPWRAVRCPAWGAGMCRPATGPAAAPRPAGRARRAAPRGRPRRSPGRVRPARPATA